MYVCALMYVRANVKSDCTCSNICIYIYTIIFIIKYIIIYIYIYIITYGSEVWNRDMERILQTGMEWRYGTGVWNGCGPGPCSGPYNLTCTHIWYPDSSLHQTKSNQPSPVMNPFPDSQYVWVLFYGWPFWWLTICSSQHDGAIGGTIPSPNSPSQDIPSVLGWYPKTFLIQCHLIPEFIT